MDTVDDRINKERGYQLGLITSLAFNAQGSLVYRRFHHEYASRQHDLHIILCRITLF
jgi:hypothetical protein